MVVVGVAVVVGVGVVVAVVVVVGVAVVVAVVVVVGVAVGVGVVTNRERRKGIEYEREVAAIWRAHGFMVQDLQHNVADLGDSLVIGNGLVLLTDPKRREVLRVREWIEQMEANAGSFADTVGTPLLDSWAIPFRWSGSRHRPVRSYVVTPLEDLVRLLA